MKKVNFNTVYNDFGDELPGKIEFFADPRNEVSRVMLRRQFGGGTDLRAFQRFSRAYAKFVAELKASKAPKEPLEKQDEAK
ncbi:hypothetical protein KIT04_155 [Vibrio phage KIT04]|nr:hypothetical protein KIT04_155 [Vibrio phage KIT04]